MAAVPGKRKPPTPPKPPLLGHLAGPALVIHGDSYKGRCDSRLQGGGRTKDDHVYDEIVSACKETAVEKKTDVHKAKPAEALDDTLGATTRERTQCCDVLKSSIDKPSVKPPLLPKPQTSPNIHTTSPNLGSRPLIPSRSNLVPSIARNGKELAVHSKKKKPPSLNSTATNNHGQIANKRFPLHIKAPVAKLEEFEGFSDTVKSDSPVRPPRSPKHQPFKGEPFKGFDEKPQLPLKRKEWNCHAAHTVPGYGSNFEAQQMHWQTTKEKSASLGRTNAFRYVEAKAKSASLGKNMLADFSSYLVNQEESCSLGSKNTPVPPPRQKKKQCGHSHSIPLYAEVNYSLKKNRRQTAKEPKECSDCVIDADDAEVQGQMAVIEGKLILPGPKNESSVSKVEKIITEACESSEKNRICQNIEAMKEPNEIEVVKEVGVCGKEVNIVDECETLNSLHLDNDCVISQDKVLNTSDLDFTITDNNDCVSHICSVDNKTSQTSGNISPVVELEVKLPAKESSTSSSLLLETEVNSLAEKSLITSPFSAPAEEKHSDSYLECSSADAQEDLKPGNVKWQSSKLSVPGSALDSAEHRAVERNSSELYHIIYSRSEKFSESEVAVFTNTESVDSVKDNSGISVNNAVDNFEVKCTEQVLVKERDVISLVDADVSQNAGSDDTEYKLSAASLLVKRKLEMKELGKLPRRKLSWSNCKDDSPSPETTLHRLPCAHKHKSKTHSLWCDEGELSSGVLGDLDSSDTTARQSSFEEVDQAGSDAEDRSNLVQSKLSTWLGSFGKGNRKQKIIRDSNSHFYCDSKENFDQTTREGEPEKEQIPVVEVTESASAEMQEIEVGGLNFTILDGSRPPSGLSTLSALDIDQKSDVPVSEESFEVYHHSESENETEIYPEDRDENHSQAEETRQDKKAFYIAQELMTSERAFIDVLKLLSVDFRQAVHAVAARQRYPVIPDAELDKILNSLPQLQSLNEDLLRDLENRINNWNSVKKIADVIVRKGPFLKLYTSYIQNFESQCIFLDECCQKYHRFAKVVKEFEASPRCQKLSLKHYMLKPVQRIPQYRLLLEDYLHHLSPFSPDLDDTRTALKIVCDVADHANRSIKLGDHLSKLLSEVRRYSAALPANVTMAQISCVNCWVGPEGHGFGTIQLEENTTFAISHTNFTTCSASGEGAAFTAGRTTTLSDGVPESHDTAIFTARYISCLCNSGGSVITNHRTTTTANSTIEYANFYNNSVTVCCSLAVSQAVSVSHCIFRRTTGEDIQPKGVQLTECILTKDEFTTEPLPHTISHLITHFCLATWLPIATVDPAHVSRTTSLPFSGSKPFSPSSVFPASPKFSPSSRFPASQQFTPSVDFAQSVTFSGSSGFSPSRLFTSSTNFGESGNFSPSPTSPSTSSATQFFTVPIQLGYRSGRMMILSFGWFVFMGEW